MSARTKVLKVSDPIYAHVRAHAAAKGVGLFEAAELLISTAVSRLASLEKDRAKKKGAKS